MKRIFKSEHFLGKHKKNYFEGWYFRHAGLNPFSFIAGISKNSGDSHSFIQYIDSAGSNYFRFPLSDFSYDKKDMTVKVGKSSFSLNGIDAEIEDKDTQIVAKLVYENKIKFKKSLYCPSVMGPFSYLPMPCSHSVISLEHHAKGVIQRDGVTAFVNCPGYIEKDFGSRFPENYVWMHAIDKKTSIMCAVAWPLIFGIRGFLCVFTYQGRQYNLSLYTGAKLKKFKQRSNGVQIFFKKGGTEVKLEIEKSESAKDLKAPSKGGKMDIDIKEDLNAKLKAEIRINGEPVEFSAGSCAFESVIR